MSITDEQLANAGTTETTTKSTRGRKPGQKAKVRQELSADEFVLEEVAPEDRGFHRRRRGERSEYQQKFDRLILARHQQWKEMGSPSDWNKANVVAIPVPRSKIEDTQFVIGKAAGLHALKVTFGNVSDKDKFGKKYPDSKWRIPFMVTDRRTEVENAPDQEN